MTSESINRELRHSPFLPFRLVMTDGKTYDIRHPDYLWVGHVEATVATAAMTEVATWDRHDTLDIFHITRIEPLPSPPPGSLHQSNGAK